MSWTDERVELLTDLWGKGLSASQIAGQLGGVTRNAVIGKVHRLGLPKRGTASRIYSKPKKSKPKQKSTPLLFRSPELPRAVIYNGLRFPPQPKQLVAFTDLKKGQCKFIHGDPAKGKAWGYCGKPTEPGSSYCADCDRIVTHPRGVKS